MDPSFLPPARPAQCIHGDPGQEAVRSSRLSLSSVMLPAHAIFWGMLNAPLHEVCGRSGLPLKTCAACQKCCWSRGGIGQLWLPAAEGAELCPMTWCSAHLALAARTRLGAERGSRGRPPPRTPAAGRGSGRAPAAPPPAVPPPPSPRLRAQGARVPPPPPLTWTCMKEPR